jgi:hypothetical protein
MNEIQKPLEDVVSERLAHPRYDALYSLWVKALARLDDDRDGAITAARALVEATIKLALGEMGVPYEVSWDLPKLYHELASELGLAPKQQSDALFRSVFGAAQSVVNGVGEMRNKFGDAHGKDSSSFQVSRHHAELAINLAGSICCFVISSLESAVAAKKRIAPDGTVILKFDVATVWRLVDHARTAKRQMTYYGKRLRKRTLCLVGDSGIYLISNGLPAMDERGNLVSRAEAKKKKDGQFRLLVAMAEGCDPAYNAFEDWWAVHNAIDGGNDFSHPIPIEQFESALPRCKSQIIIRMRPDEYQITSDTGAD